MRTFDRRKYEKKYDVRNAGRRMLEKPDHGLIVEVFGGDFERYKQCVIANFGECDPDAGN
jgi:hypothetical protein